MSDVGIYLVTLANEHPISVNAQDPRMAEQCIKVTRVNCKVGKAKSFRARERNYWKTFGAQYVTFRPIALTEELHGAERAILHALLHWRVRSESQRRTEWLEGISPFEAEQIALAALRTAGIAFSLPPVSGKS